MTTIKMKTEHIDNTLIIDRRNFLQGMGIATVGIVAVKVTGGVGSSNTQALSGSIHGKVAFNFVRKPRKQNMARFKKVKPRSAQVV